MARNNKLAKRTGNALVGSQADMAQRNQTSLAETWMNVDMVTLCDTSGSMDMSDKLGGDTRYERLLVELEKLMKRFEGKVAVFSFSGLCEWCPSGIPTPYFGNTDMLNALKHIYHQGVDDLGVKIALLSDGSPDYGQETEILGLAKLFKTKIDTIYIGPEDADAIKFMRQLANASGGSSETNLNLQENLLSETLGQKLLGTGSIQL